MNANRGFETPQALRLRSREFKELEIVVLRHELAVLRRQVARPRLEESDRVFLAAASRLLRRTRLQHAQATPSTQLTPPMPRRRLHLVGSHQPTLIQRRDRLGGLIHEYARAA